MAVANFYKKYPKSVVKCENFHKYYLKPVAKYGIFTNITQNEWLDMKRNTHMNIFDIRISNWSVGLRRKKGGFSAAHPYPPWEEPRLKIKTLFPDTDISNIKAMKIQYW